MPSPRPELTANEIDAIVSLLLDADDRTDSRIAEQLLERPPASRAAVLERAAASGVGVSTRLARVLRLNRRELLATHFAHLPRDEDGDVDLESAVLLLARIGMEDFDEAGVRRQLDSWADDVHMAASIEAGPRAELEGLRTVLFDRLGFHGEHEDYYAPENSFLPYVIEARKGLPITLSVVLLVVARRLDLPVEGVGMPGHFIVAYHLPEGPVYLDPFESGEILTTEECYQRVQEMGHPTRNALAVARPNAIIVRMLRNLAHAYLRADDHEGVADCQACLHGLTASFTAHE